MKNQPDIYTSRGQALWVKGVCFDRDANGIVAFCGFDLLVVDEKLVFESLHEMDECLGAENPELFAAIVSALQTAAEREARRWAETATELREWLARRR